MYILFAILTTVSAITPTSLNQAWLPTTIDTPTSADCILSHFQQPLDHFDSQITSTFKQRYFYNDTFFQPSGPILYYTGNEADVTLYVNATGLMWENAAELGALLVFGEHRYYGESSPFPNTTTTNNLTPAQLKWLSVEQSLADHANLITHVKATIPGAFNSKVVAIGGSYGGMQSSWIRMKYPHVVDGAIAGSAPILAFDDVSKASAKKAGPLSYWKIVTDDATEAFGSTKECSNNVRRAWDIMDAMFATGSAGKHKLGQLFRLCAAPSTLAELYALKIYLQMAFDTMAMGNFPFPSSYLASGLAILPAYPFRKACSYLGNLNDDDETLLTNLGLAAAVFNNATLNLQCFDLPTDPDYDGIWDYMWCTDTLCQETYFGRNGKDDMFWSFQYDEHAIDVHCRQKYNITPSYTNIAHQFGGIEGVRNASNIVFSNGRFDPWRSGGVTSINDTERSLWSIVIPNGAHHVDLMFTTAVDPPDLGIARKFEVDKIKEWVGWNAKQEEMSMITCPLKYELPGVGLTGHIIAFAATTPSVKSCCSIAKRFDATSFTYNSNSSNTPRDPACRVFGKLRSSKTWNRNCSSCLSFSANLTTDVAAAATVVSPSPIYPNITTVHVINSCHLDIGFKDSSMNIINLYFDHHLPKAASVGRELRKLQTTTNGYTDNKLNFMFQSWVISMFFDCPPNLGLHCPNATSKTNIRGAIHAGDITWHAFPHNAQLEVMGTTFIQAGLQLTRDVDAMFPNQPMKRTLSQRDVPGMPRSIIPLLNRSGVSAISIGANDGSTPPKLPKTFVWKDTVTNTSILGLFNWPGYGHLGEEVVVPNLKHALVYNWNGDNDGPYDADDYVQNWKSIQTMFPNAKIYASTLDNFTSNLNAIRNELPVVEAEVGDTWVYGIPSDPQKVARMLAMERVWSAVGNNTNGKDLVLKNATRFALKLGEHTDGKDVKTFLKDNTNWKNKDFEKARAVGSKNASQYAALESSWWEQREWGITVAMNTLKEASHPMFEKLVQEFKELKPKVPLVNDKERKKTKTFTCNGATIEFNDDGSLSGLVDAEKKIQWSDATHPLVAVRYRTYSSKDVSHFFSTYCQSTADWVHRDYGKPNMPNDTIGQIWLPTLESLYVVETETAELTESTTNAATKTCVYVSHATFETAATLNYGAVTDVWTNYTVTVNSNGGLENIDVTMGLFNKSATRLPESMFVQFHPLLSSTAADTQWMAETLGSWSSPNQVLDGGSKRLFGSQKVRTSGLTDGLTITSRDSAVASFGMLNAYPIPTNKTADVEDYGVSFVLWDNLWGTNYVQWWPFVVPPPVEYGASSEFFPVEGNADFAARFEMKFS